jgi:quercetin dioxygenase-like cupin family protein
MKNSSRTASRITAATFAIAATFVMTGLASAGECPADKVKAGAVTSGESMPVGVTDMVIGSIDLSPKGGDFTNGLLRLRKLVVAPGGVVPWHDHSERPANIYILSGEIVEHRSTCLVPIVHRAGEVTSEFGKDLAHWWKNESSAPVELLSADIVKMEKKDDSMM